MKNKIKFTVALLIISLCMSSYNMMHKSFNLFEITANQKPIPKNDSFTTLINTSINFNVLSNDSDPDGNKIYVSRFVVNGTNYLQGKIANNIKTTIGTLLLNKDGSGTFTPLNNYTGILNFNYTCTDGIGNGRIAQVKVVTKKNDPVPPPVIVPNSFVLTSESVTSAGVFKRNGVLIRTLWNNKKYPAGTFKIDWDKKDDNGNIITDTGYIFKVVSNNVSYTWDAIIGNTSSLMVGPTVHKAFDRIHHMAISGNNVYYSTGYNEAETSSFKFILSDIGKKVSIMPTESGDNNQGCEYIATDDNLVYWAGYDCGKPTTSFTFATNVSDDREFLLSSGKSVATQWGRTYQKAIDVTLNDATAVPTGIAVQKNGQYLFIAHGKQNKLNVLVKSTGAFVTSISMNKVREICIDGNDNLWAIIDENTVNKYSINLDGTLTTPKVVISGLQEPLSIAVSKDNLTVAIIDGGSSQQVKAFDNATGASKWILGQLGGYQTNINVSNDRFYFNDKITGLSKPYLMFCNDGSYWIGDVGNERAQHFSSSNTYLDQVMYLPHTYSVRADRNNTKRIFAGYLEFEDNISSWKLVKNWRAGITKNYFEQGMVNVFLNVVTLNNGRTYATLENWTEPTQRNPDLIELTPNGIRYTGIKFGMFESLVLETDGSLRRLTDKNWNRQSLNGFDANNNPLWSAAVNISNVPIRQSQDPINTNGNLSYIEATSSGILIAFNPSHAHTGNHLGGVRNGVYVFQTAKSTLTTYSGPYPNDGLFDCGNGVWYAGGNVRCLDRSIFYNYVGEGWKNSQVNKFTHVFDNGLLIGIFGITTPEAIALDGNHAPRQASGNSYAWNAVRTGNDYYIYHNDESVHGGIHRWKISGIETIKEQTIEIKY